MKYFILFICVLGISLTAQPAKSYERIFKEFVELEMRKDSCAVVSNFVIKRDVGVFTLKTGKIFLTTEINNKIRAVVFKGEGNFRFSPPTQIERKHLYRFYEKEELDEDFEELVLLFADNTLTEIKSKMKFVSTEENQPNVSPEKIMTQYIVYEDEQYFPSEIAKSILESEQNKLFFAAFKDTNGDPMFFKVDPYDYEDIELLRSYKNHMRHNLETVSKFPSRNANPDGKDVHSFKVTGYNLDSRIDDSYSLDFSGSTSLTLTPEYNNQYWLPFSVYYKMEIDSVFLNNRKVSFMKGDENPVLWVRSDSALIKNKEYNLKFFYNGDLLYRNTYAWIMIRSIHNWYVNTLWENSADYNIKFTVPQKWNIICTGNKISENNIDDDYYEIIWNGKKFQSAAFSVGLYKNFHFAEDGLPDITVYRNQVAFGNWNMEKEVGADVVNSISFFQNMFGPAPFKEMVATDMPVFHGEAFPGFIHLSFLTFLENGYTGSMEAFRAHEVAHQWWGISVDWATYHDQWLSEAFAEYSGLWYMQAVLQDNEKFFDMLEDYREEIMNNRHYLFSDGQEAGPIWLGYRTNSSETAGDYGLIVYKKGAWVLHMLRMMLINQRTMNEDLFINMMKDYYQSFKGKKARTEDFINIVSKHFGEDMSWFFNQYVYNTEIPTYKFSYKSEETQQGKYLVTCKVLQENVPVNFRMYIPILIKFGNDQFARLRIQVDGRNPIVKLPLLPLEPEEIIFNDMSSVLCDFDYEKWKG